MASSCVWQNETSQSRRFPKGYNEKTDHVFSRVCIIRANSAMFREVLAQDVRVLPNVAEVDGPAASLEEEQPVKVLEQESVRLVNSDEDRLSGGGEFAKEADDVVGGLAVEAGSRFVEEQQELRLRGEFDTDCDTLPRLDVETEAGETDHGVGEIFELEETDDLLDVGVLLSLRDVSGLTEVCREAERFADGSGTLVSVELLGVGGATLELGTRRTTRNQTVTADDADILAVGQNVEKGRLSGTRGSHEGRELARANISENVVEELALTARNRDRVAVAMTLGD